ncbi:MAG: GntR family transcriptional regulator [Gemmatimonadales bacterium]
MKSTPLQRLREMILSGELKPGERITEVGLAERLGISRTPIRSALPILAADGYIEPVGKRGYSVKKFDGEEAIKALELRAVLEGVAARYLAQAGASEEVLTELESCLRQGDELFGKRYLTYEDEERYGEMNARFHQIIVENCGSAPLIAFVERLNKMPFINPSVLVFDQVGLETAYDLLFRAHGQHHALTEAIRGRDAARAEVVFREHGNAQRQSLFSRADRTQAMVSAEVRPLDAEVRPPDAEVRPPDDEVRPLDAEATPIETERRPAKSN